MSVTVKFAERMKPPSAVNPQPTITEVPDEVIAAGSVVDTKDGWLIVADSAGHNLAAYCPGSVLRATVDGAVAGTEVPAEVGPTEAPSGSAAMDAANAGAAPVDVLEPSDAEPADVPTVG